MPLAESIAPKFKEDGVEFVPIPEWTKEDFENTSIPHAWVMEMGAGNPYLTIRYRDCVAKYAKTLGISRFVSQYNRYEEAHKSGGITRASNATDFEDQPLELMVGDYIANDDVGVMGYNHYHDMVQVCNHPIMPTKRLINVDSGETQLEIAYKRGGRWKSQVVPRSMLATASQIVGLSAWGVGVDSENAKALVRYFTEVEHLNYSALPEILSTSRLGWVGSGLFAPYVEGLQYDGDPSGASLYSGVKAAGSPTEWLNYFGRARSRSVVLKLAIAASFASCMVKPLKALPFILHMWGGTEAGKTVGLMAAISVWGNPSQDGGLFHTFNTTDVGVETLASVSNSVPVFIDELQIAKDRKSFDEFIYKFAEGVGRTRGAKTGGLQQMKRWANTAITTGEMPISTAASGGGAMNRVIEIDCKGQHLFENPREAVSVMLENHGHAGRHFVSILQANLDRTRELQEMYLKQLQSTEATDKQALSASLLLTADHLASDWMFGEETRLTVEEIVPFLSTKTQVDVNRRALDWLYGWVAEHQNNFIGGGDAAGNGIIYGKYYEDSVAIIYKTFTDAMLEAGFNPSAFVAWAKDQPGLLACGGGRVDKLVKLHGSKSAGTRCIVIKFGESDENEPMEQVNIDDLPM